MLKVTARFKRSAETRARIIRTAADLFHQKGARATSPDEIIDASRTGKGQFYHYFKSKAGLVHEVLQTYLDEINRNTAPVAYEIDSWRDMERWFLAQLELQRRFNMARGCPFGTIANEVSDNDELIRQDLNLIFEVIKSRLTAFLVREKARGKLSRRANPESLADFCIATVQGAMLMGKVKRNSRTVETTIRESLAHLRSYLKQGTPRALSKPL